MAYKGTLNDKYYTPSFKPDTGGYYTAMEERKKAQGISPSGAVTTPKAPATTTPKSPVTTTPTTSTAGGSNAYSSLLNAYLNSGKSYADERLAAQRAAVQDAYNNGMNALNSAYNTQLSDLRDKYDFTVGQLNSSYDNSANKINSNAENSLREAYINRMLSQKNLGQQMAAQGLSGGATESTLAGLFNNYGNARNNIETTKANNLSDLAFTKDNNLAEALRNYNSAIASADSQRMAQIMNLENARANNQISALGDYYGMLSNDNDNYMALLRSIIGNMNDYKWTPAEVTNLVNNVNTRQASTDANSNYSAALQNLLNANGGGSNTGATGGANTAANALMLQALLNQQLA